MPAPASRRTRCLGLLRELADRRGAPRALLGLGVVALALAASAPASAKSSAPIRLKSRTFVPVRGLAPNLPAVTKAPRHGLIQFTRLPSRGQRAALARAGVKLSTYVPDRAFLATIPADARPVLKLKIVRSILPLGTNDKIHSRALTPDEAGSLNLTVRFFDDVAPTAAADAIRARRGRITEELPDFDLLRVALPADELERLLVDDRVQWVDPILPNVVTNDTARAATGVDVAQAAPYGLSGAGSKVGEWDAGHAISAAGVVHHDDLLGRVVAGDAIVPGNDLHATHVAGTVLGDGTRSMSDGGATVPFAFRGMAPQANLVAYDWTSFLGEYSAAISSEQIDVSTNSWMSGASGTYSSDSAGLDNIITGQYGKRIPIVWAAGNQRLYPSACTGYQAPGKYCMADYASAKNTIAVGASNADDDSMTTYSSWGPTKDGRVKPDLVAPGCRSTSSTGMLGLKSTMLGNTYGNSCGTSMAAPVVSGSIALLQQRNRQLCGPGTPSALLPSTIKALLLHTARDLADSTSWYNRGPDYSSGYGRLDTKAAIDLLPFHRESTVNNGATLTFPITVAAQKNLKVTLVWDDPPAAPNAAVTLIDNLDLELVGPGGTPTRRPWRLDPNNPSNTATRAVDDRNVVEQVVVDSAAAGKWTIRVKGTNVPAGSQRFSIVTEQLAPKSCGGPSGHDVWGADDPSSDIGNEPDSATPVLWASDDIRVRNTLGDGPHQDPEFGQTNYAYVTVRNRSTQPVPNARVFLYRTTATTGATWPANWTQLGSATVVNLPASGSTVVGPIPWDPPGTGHYCLYVRMVSAGDPFKVAETASVWVNTRENNEIIWRNLNVVDDLAQGPKKVEFLMRNVSARAVRDNLLFREPERQLADPFLKHGRVVVDLASLGGELKRRGVTIRGMEKLDGSRYRIVDPARAAVIGIALTGHQVRKIGVTFSATRGDGDAAKRRRFDVIQEHARVGGPARDPVGGVSYVIGG